MRYFVLVLIILALSLSVSAQTGYTIPTVNDFEPISAENGLDILAFPGLSQFFGYGLWWSPDGSQFALSSGGSVLIYAANDFSALPQRISAMYAETGQFSFNPTQPDTAYLANKNSNGDAYVAVVDLPTGAITDHFDCVGEYAPVSPNGRRLLSQGEGQYVIFDLDRNARQLAFETFNLPLALGDRGVYMLDTPGNTVYYRDLIDNSEQLIVSLAEAGLIFPSLSPDLSRSAHVGDDRTVYVFDLSRPEAISEPLDGGASDRLLATITPPVEGVITALDVTTRATAVAYDGGIVTISSVEYGDFQLTETPFEEDAVVLALQPEGSLLALRLYDGQVQLWDLATRSLVAKLGSEFSIIGFWFDADSQPIAYITYQGADWGWNLLTNEVTQLNTVPMLAPTTSATSMDGSVTFSVTGADTVEVSALGETRTIYSGDVEYVTVSPDGRFLAAWDSTNIFLMRELTAGEQTNPSCIAAG